MVETNAKLATKVAHLESNIESLANSMGRLSQAVETNAKETRQAITNIATQISESQKTPWGTLGTWAGVLLATAGIIGSLVAFGMNSKIDYLYMRMEDHILSPAHTGALENMGRNDERLKMLEREIFRLTRLREK